MAEAALAADATDPEVCAYVGYALGFCGAGQARGLRLVEDATRRCPSFAWAWTSAALMSAYLGRAADEALSRAATATRLDPRDPLAFRNNMAVSLRCFIKGDWAQLLENARRRLELNPRAHVFQRNLAVAPTRLGRDDEATVPRRRHMEAAPDFRLRAFGESARGGIGVVEALWRPMIEGMRDAGFPE